MRRLRNRRNPLQKRNIRWMAEFSSLFSLFTCLWMPNSTNVGQYYLMVILWWILLCFFLVLDLLSVFL